MLKSKCLRKSSEKTLMILPLYAILEFVQSEFVCRFSCGPWQRIRLRQTWNRKELMSQTQLLSATVSIDAFPATSRRPQQWLFVYHRIQTSVDRWQTPITMQKWNRRHVITYGHSTLNESLCEQRIICVVLGAGARLARALLFIWMDLNEMRFFATQIRQSY